METFRLNRKHRYMYHFVYACFIFHFGFSSIHSGKSYHFYYFINQDISYLIFIYSFVHCKFQINAYSPPSMKLQKMSREFLKNSEYLSNFSNTGNTGNTGIEVIAIPKTGIEKSPVFCKPYMQHIFELPRKSVQKSIRKSIFVVILLLHLLVLINVKGCGRLSPNTIAFYQSTFLLKN